MGEVRTLTWVCDRCGHRHENPPSDHRLPKDWCTIQTGADQALLCPPCLVQFDLWLSLRHAT